MQVKIKSQEDFWAGVMFICFGLLAVVVAFYPVFQLIAPRLGPLTHFLCALGRNSLAVFSVCSLAALAGQIVRFIGDGSFLVDLAIVAFGLCLMGCTAWISDRYKSAD